MSDAIQQSIRILATRVKLLGVKLNTSWWSSMGHQEIFAQHDTKHLLPTRGSQPTWFWQYQRRRWYKRQIKIDWTRKWNTFWCYCGPSCVFNSIINNNGDTALQNDSYLLVFPSRHYSDHMSVFYGIRGSSSETEGWNETCFINILSDNVIPVWKSTKMLRWHINATTSSQLLQ